MKIWILSILTFVLVWSSQQGVDATRVVKKMQNRRGSRQLKERFYPTYGESMPNSLQYRKTSTIFNVLHFGAKGDGTTDDTKVIVFEH